MSSATEGRPAGVLLTLDRGLQVLEEVARERGRATAKGLSAKLEINIGTCYQLLRTLSMHGYVCRLPDSCFGLGPRIGYLLDHYERLTSPPPRLLAVLRELHSRIGDSVYVSLKMGNQLAIVSYLEGTNAVRVGPIHVGFSDYPHARASGKAFLAYVESSHIEAYLDKDRLPQLTNRTITSWAELRSELEATRARGYAIEVEEFAEGVACLGAVLVAPSGAAQGALGVSMPASVPVDYRERIAGLVVEAGRRGSAALGYRGPYPPPSVQDELLE